MLIPAVLAALALAASAPGRTSPPSARPAQPDPLAVLAFLVGDWEGEGQSPVSPSSYLFDDAGVWVFAGQAVEGGVLFEARRGSAVRRTRLTLDPDGTLHIRNENHLPDGPPGLPVDTVFESRARPRAK
jgi:hypothetical protein